MRMMTLLLAASLTGVAAAASADGVGNFRMVGAGAVVCSKITSDIAAGPNASAEIASWLMGYVTGVNRQTPETWDLMGEGGIEAYYAAVQAVCAANPDKMLESAAFDVLKKGYATRAINKP